MRVSVANEPISKRMYAVTEPVGGGTGGVAPGSAYGWHQARAVWIVF